MNIQIVIDEKEISRILHGHLTEVCKLDVTPGDIVIQVKSRQNYKSEWETAQFRAVVNKVTTP